MDRERIVLFFNLVLTMIGGVIEQGRRIGGVAELYERLYAELKRLIEALCGVETARM